MNARHPMRNRRRGMSLIEIMIAVSFMGIVFLAVAFIQVITAQQVRSLYGDARTLHRAHLVLERIRFKLCMGQIGSAVVKDSGRTLEYTNPNNNSGVVSMFKMTDKKLYYYEDKTLAASTPGQGIGPVEDMLFEIQGAGNAVRVTATTLQKFSWKLNRPFTLDTVITLRN